MSVVSNATDPRQACLDIIKQFGGKPCSDEYCQSGLIPRFVAAICTCQPPYRNGCAGDNPPPDCCAYTAATPIPLLPGDCYCCCGEVAGMEVAEPGGQYRPIREYRPGDNVATVEEIDGSTWASGSARVAWSGGVDDAGGSQVRLDFEDGLGGTATMDVSRDQLFLTTPRELRPAWSLVAGKDALVGSTGRPRTVLSVREAPSGRPLHHLATTTAPAVSTIGHLLVVNGVVCADWALQVGYLTGLLETGAPAA
jgi:hypothetical protein